MDTATQLQQLLALAEEARERVGQLESAQADAAQQIDTAAYDLKRLIDDVRRLLSEPAPEKPSNVTLAHAMGASRLGHGRT
jgi:hypothetical protein